MTWLFLLSSFLTQAKEALPDDFPLFKEAMFVMQASRSLTAEEYARGMGLEPRDLHDFLDDLKDHKILNKPPPRMRLEDFDLHVQYPGESESTIDFQSMEKGFLLVNGKKISIEKYIPYRQLKVLLSKSASKKTGEFLSSLFFGDSARADITTIGDSARTTGTLFYNALVAQTIGVKKQEEQEGGTYELLFGEDTRKHPESWIISAYHWQLDAERKKKDPAGLSLNIPTFKCEDHHLTAMSLWSPILNGVRQEYPANNDRTLTYTPHKYTIVSYIYTANSRVKVTMVTDEDGKIISNSNKDANAGRPGQSSDFRSAFINLPKIAHRCCQTDPCYKKVSDEVSRIQAKYGGSPGATDKTQKKKGAA